MPSLRNATIIKNYINFNRIVKSAFDFLDFLSLIEYIQNSTDLLEMFCKKRIYWPLTFLFVKI